MKKGLIIGIVIAIIIIGIVIGVKINSPNIDEEGCLEFNNLSLDSNSVCCGKKQLKNSLSSTEGVLEGYGCCDKNTCHEYSSSGYGCMVHGGVLTGETYNTEKEFYYVCNRGDWAQLDCNKINCSQLQSWFMILKNFEGSLLDN